MYNDKVLDLFKNPKNVGAMPDANEAKLAMLLVEI